MHEDEIIVGHAVTYLYTTRVLKNILDDGFKIFIFEIIDDDVLEVIV